jgi:3-phosphoshikimate 1-carboxyvinyltransferase
MQLSSKPSGPLKGECRVPGDKSISHRALIFGALATGETRISGLLESEDVINTARAVAALGAKVDRDGAEWVVRGCGIGGLSSPEADLDFGNAGTGSRLMMGVIAGNPVTATLTGDASLCRRPMGRVLGPLREMGLETDPRDGNTLPLTLRGAADPLPITYRLPVASAQVKSAILLAGLHSAGETTVIEPEATRDHTERMLAHFGQPPVVTVDEATGERRIAVKGRQDMTGRPVMVPADPSSAAFLAAAAAIVPGSDLLLRDVLTNPTRTGFYTTLQEMGADLTFENERIEAGEPIADIRVRHAPLTGVTVPPERAPSMIDEYPILGVVAAFAAGETRMLGLAELKVKESDRLAATSLLLGDNGVSLSAGDDTLYVTGGGKPAGGATVHADLDHRIAMAALVLGLASETAVTVDDASPIATSFPTFQADVERLGGVFS